jgi:hypothetical protein
LDVNKLWDFTPHSICPQEVPGTHVTVKRVCNNSREGERGFLAEVHIISQLRHCNVVELMDSAES